jgi:hypothetical protein
MGFGTLTKDGVRNSVTASGSVTTENVTLTTKLTTPETSGQRYDECDLNLFKTEDHLSWNLYHDVRRQDFEQWKCNGSKAIGKALGLI